VSREATDNVLEIEGLCKVFRRGKKATVTAVDDMSLSIQRGQLVGLLGPNGAGKTTTIKCVLGLVRPTKGTMRICGYDVETEYRHAIEHTSAVLEGARNTYWRMTPRENVRFFAGLHGLDYKQHRPYFDTLFERFGLVDVIDEPVMNLSTGMKQKVSVVCALSKQTELVFLDEPTLGLDVETSIELRQVLRRLAEESGRTIVVSSHDMDVIQDVCERVIIIKDGRVVVDNSIDSLLALFRTRSYRILLSDSVEPNTAARLQPLVHGLSMDRKGSYAELQFTLPAPMRLYDVIDILRESGVIIDSIAQREPDLEEAFLRIIRHEGSLI